MDYIGLIKEIDRWCRKNLKFKRYLHVKRVEKFSIKLAVRYGVDTGKTQIAALAHDMARHWDRQEMRHYLEQAGRPLSEEEQLYPYCLHGLCAATMLKVQWKCSDKDILNAVRFHTTGRASMSRLEKVIFLADYLEPGRKHVSKKLRQKTKTKDLDTMIRKIVKRMLRYQSDREKTIHPKTLDLARELGISEG